MRQTNEARRESLDETHDYLATVRREQLALRARVQEEVDAIDQKLLALTIDARKGTGMEGGVVVDPRSKDAARIRALLQRRETLTSDMSVLERADERAWDEVKANIEQDLNHGGRI